jgi:hypothetical protein
MQRNGLVHSSQLVKSIRPQRANAQAKIDFREGWNRHSHRGTI